MDLVSLANNLLAGVLLGGILALAALGLSIALGVMRLVNLAHGEILVGGAYLGFYLLSLTGLDPLLALPLIGLAMALLVYPLHRLLLAPLQLQGPEAPMMTMFGVSIILQNAMLLLFSADTRSIDRSYAARPLQLGPLSVPLIYVLGFAISVLLIIAVHLLITRTRFGREMRASAADPRAAAANGVDVRRIHALSFALGAGCAAMGGTLIGIAFSFSPSSGASYLLSGFAIVVLGGLGNIFATLVAGIALGLLQSLGGVVFGDGYRELVGLALFLLVLAVRPQGLIAARGA
ncbi:MAG: branched-chain amino acid ABC transporter permease [Steroidobacteraceae bacterium]|jgi:branched-chain amino acid transport system permease protein